MPSLATLAGVANPPDEEQRTSIMKPTNAFDAGTANDIDPANTAKLNTTQVLPSNDANSQGQSAVVPTGIGDLLKNGFDSSNILGTVTPLATGLIGLLGNQQSTDTLKKGAADATKTIQDGNTNIQNLLKSIYGEQSQILQPYTALGEQGVAGLSAGIAPGGDLVSGYHGPTDFKFTAGDLAQDPGMQFRIAEQNKLLARRQASSGSLSSGAALKAGIEYAGHQADQEFGTAYSRNENTFNGNFNRGLTEQQSNQQQKLQALMDAAGIGQNASNTLVGAKGQQGQQSATTQQLTNSQTADLQTSLASAIAAGDTTRANQISGIISGTLGAVQSASDAAKARAAADQAKANQPANPNITITNQGSTANGGAGGAGGDVGNVTGGSVGDVSVETGDVSNTQGDQTNTQGDQTQTGDPDGTGTVIGIHGVDADGNPTIDISGNQTKGSGSTVGKVLTAANTGVGLLKNLLTKGNTSTVNGLADGSVSTAASSAAKSLMQSGDAGLSAVGGFLTNPITIGVGAALAGALLWKKSQAHPTATTFVDSFQKPFGDHLGNVVDGFDTALATGKLDKATAQGLYDQTKSFIDGFESDTAKFATEGGKNAKVAQQAKDTMTKNFGPNYEKILGKMQSEIANLPDPAGGGMNHTTVQQQTGVQRLAGIAQGGGQ